jgi:hypothetical protein
MTTPSFFKSALASFVVSNCSANVVSKSNAGASSSTSAAIRFQSFFPSTVKCPAADFVGPDADLSHSAEIISTDLRRLWRAETSVRDRIKDRVLDLLVANNSPKSVRLMHQSSFAPYILQARHVIAKQQLKPKAVIILTHFPIEEGHRHTARRESAGEVQRQVGFRSAAGPALGDCGNGLLLVRFGAILDDSVAERQISNRFAGRAVDDYLGEIDRVICFAAAKAVYSVVV